MEDRDQYKNELSIIKTWMHRFHSIECLALQVECASIYFNLKIFDKAILPDEAGKVKIPPIKELEIMNSRASLFELINAHLYADSLKRLSVNWLEIDMFSQYIEDVDQLMEEKHLLFHKANPFENLTSLAALHDFGYQSIPIITSQL